ncbi:MAG: maleylpyruvate isomerase family mycothiol-dependent enzyme [Actinomycetota bacterium]|nr:maleylpyruvate isomerase family mycothiol-dependent enzyme [Acidimicrobiia bacterium]MDQ3147661.1 maleylpyruvate isomerase family mycothiol-dependent enzyme [Actinomycetota bacterium]
MALFDVVGARRVVAAELGATTERVVLLNESDWARPTRCTEWTIADLVSHMGLAALQQAEAFRRAITGDLEPPAFPGAPRMSRDALTEQLQRGAAELDDALGGVPPESLDVMVPLPFGVVPATVAIQIPVFESSIHGNDLAAAMGEDEPLASAVAAAFIEFAPGLLPMLAAGVWKEAVGDLPSPGLAYQLVGASGGIDIANHGVGWEIGAAIDDLPTCAISSDDATLALFLMGRVASSDPRLKISGTAPGAAENFKSWFPGP